MTDQTTATAAARQVVSTLVTTGVRDIVLAPGSRSAPLAYALAAAEGAGALTVHVRVDERVAAFTALGIARVRPAAVVTTSGTAVANLHAAIAEASHSYLPLLALTADRPAELRGVGANQTTVQPNIFAPLTRFDVDVPAGLPRGAIAQQITRAVAAARGVGAPAGPVHVNLAFRAPLVPDEPWPGPGGDHVTTVVGAGGAPAGAHHLPLGPRTVVVAGDGAGAAAADFAGRAGLPLLAEPSSGSRGGATAVRYRCALDGDLGAAIERVVLFGRTTLSRPVRGLLARAETIVVTGHPTWVDLSGTAAIVTPDVTMDPPGEGEAAWLARWRAADRPAGGGTGDPSAPLTGRGVVAACLGHGAPVTMLGSSMTVRHADVHGPAGADFTRAPVYANRGLAGIDGTVSTATGLALAHGRPVRVILGDLSLAHDLGALALGPDEAEPDIQILVLNDGGGTIFGTLEHTRADPRLLRRFFTTPLDLDLRSLAAGYQVPYERVASGGDLAGLFSRPIRGRRLVEVPLA